MRNLILAALLFSSGCAQVPTGPHDGASHSQVEPAVAVVDSEAAPTLNLTAPVALTAQSLAATATEWNGGLELEQLQQRLARVRVLRAELRGGYERAIQRLRGSFSLPTSWQKPAPDEGFPDQAARIGPSWAGPSTRIQGDD